ncbi:MAG: hypothetical protein HUK16_05605 [Bacteroidales bacterium]|nr:hypothetical protein [Bacteroidales bacterium]
MKVKVVSFGAHEARNAARIIIGKETFFMVNELKKRVKLEKKRKTFAESRTIFYFCNTIPKSIVEWLT